MSVQLIIGTDDPAAGTLYASTATLLKQGAPRLIRGDSGIELDIIPVIQNTPGAQPPLISDSIDTDTYVLGVGIADATPTSGTFQLAVNGSTTGMTALAYDIDAATLQTPLSAALVIAGYSACTVRSLGSFSFEIDATTNGAIPTGKIVGNASNLVPNCDVVVSEVSLGGASSKYQYILSLRQQALVLAFPATPLPAISVGNAVTQALSSTQNAINTVSYNVTPIAGTFNVSAYALGVTTLCGVAAFDASAADFTTLLGNHPKLTGNVSVEKIGTAFQVEFTNQCGPKPITASTVANPTHITCVAHGYTNGQSVTHSGTNSTPNTDGANTITVIDADHYSVAVNVTVAGTAGVSRDSTAPLLTVADIDLQGVSGVTGTLNVNSVNLFRASLAETAETFSDYFISVKRVRASGENRTILLTTVDISKDVIDPGATTPLPLRPGPNVGNTLYVDAVFGNDATALRESALYPFLTIGAATTASLSGDTIQVGPGAYDEVGLGKEGIDYFFQPGAAIAWSGAGTTAIFDSGGGAFNVYGYGAFDGGSVPVLNAYAQNMDFCAASAEANTDVITGVTNCQLRVEVPYLECINATAGKAVFNLTGGVTYVDSDKVIGRAAIVSNGATLYGRVTVFDDGEIVADQMIEVQDADVNLTFNRFYSVTGNCIKISHASATAMFANGDIKTTPSHNPILFSANGALRLRNVTLLPTVGRDSIETTGGATPTVVCYASYAATDVDAAVTIVGDLRTSSAFT